MKIKWISLVVIVAALAVAVTYTFLQPKDSKAQYIHAQYVENDQLTLEDIESDGTNMWSMWKRDLSPKEPDLPISSSQEMLFQFGDEQLQLKVMLQDGQMMVVSKPFTEFLQIEREFFETSEILQLSKGEHTLVLRGNTKIAYENGVKTPSSAKALRQGDDLVVPINVIANGLGYSLRWNTKEQYIEVTKVDEDV